MTEISKPENKKPRQTYSNTYLFTVAKRLEREANGGKTLGYDPDIPHTDQYLNEAAVQMGFKNYLDFINKKGVIE